MVNVTKYFILLFHRIFPILLCIGLAWGQVEPDTLASAVQPLKQETLDNSVGDAKKDAILWMAYPPVALFTSTILGVQTYDFLSDYSEGSRLVSSIVLGGYLGVTSSKYLFNNLNKKNIRDLNAKDIELYEQAHSEELKRRKSINTAIGCGITGVAVAIAVTYFVIDAALGDLRI